MRGPHHWRGQAAWLLLLALPDCERYDYICSVCGSVVGWQDDEGNPAPGIIVPWPGAGLHAQRRVEPRRSGRRRPRVRRQRRGMERK